jgi:hypothetical protein
MKTPPLDKVIISCAEEREAFRASLKRMTDAFRPFRMKPVGSPGSSARLEQDEQIAAHAEATALINQETP